MNDDNVLISRLDFDRLLEVLEHAEKLDAVTVERLDEKLARARVVEPGEVPSDLVTMNSRVRYERQNDGSVKEVSIVYPADAQPTVGRISVLSPIGVSLLGRRKGEIPNWARGSALEHVRISDVTYQPEASGHWDL